MRHIKGKYQNGKCKFYLSGNYITYEWIRLSIQKAEIGRKKNRSSSMLSVRDTFQIQRYKWVESTRAEITYNVSNSQKRTGVAD